MEEGGEEKGMKRKKGEKWTVEEKRKYREKSRRGNKK